jgi:hypothetical protein
LWRTFDPLAHVRRGAGNFNGADRIIWVHRPSVWLLGFNGAELKGRRILLTD